MSDYRFNEKTLTTLANEDGGHTHLAKLANDALTARKVEAALRKRLAKLQDDFADLYRINAGLKQEVKILNEGHDIISDELTRAVAGAAKAELKASSYEYAGREKSAKRLSATRAKLKAAQGSNTELAKQVASLRAQNLALKRPSVTGDGFEITRLNGIVQGCRTIVDNLQTENNDLVNKHAIAERDLEWSQKNYEELRGATVQIRNGSAAKTKSIHKLNDIIASLRRKNADLEEMLLSTEKDRDDHLQVRRALEPNVDHLGEIAAQGNGFRKFLVDLKYQIEEMGL